MEREVREEALSSQTQWVSWASGPGIAHYILLSALEEPKISGCLPHPWAPIQDPGWAVEDPWLYRMGGRKRKFPKGRHLGLLLLKTIQRVWGHTGMLGNGYWAQFLPSAFYRHGNQSCEATCLSSHKQWAEEWRLRSMALLGNGFLPSVPGLDFFRAGLDISVFI